MKRAWFVITLAIPVAAWAAGIPEPQAVPQAQVVAHKPLFEVKYVLLPAPKTAGDTPRIDDSDRSAAIVPLRLDTRDSGTLRPVAFHPNMEICREWACETPRQR
jgi:hypothetical protein